MDKPLDYNNIEKLPNQSLAVIQCGKHECESGHTIKHVAYEHYSLTFVYEGVGTYTINGETHVIRSGKGFLIPPDVYVSYSADENKPWKYVYAIVSGIDVEALLHAADLNANKTVFDFPTDENFTNNLFAMYEASKNYGALGYDVTGYFLLLIARLIKLNGKEKKYLADSQKYLSRALAYIENHYNGTISVESIADYVGIERTYLFKLFKQQLNKSPTEYLKDYRLKRAVEIMQDYSLSISEIAELVGFYDISHFNRVFVKKFGISPGKYKQKLLIEKRG